MSEKLLVEEAKRRARIYRELDKHLALIARVIRQLDRGAKVYLFGSVAEGRNLLSSDIDILVVTDKPPGQVLAALWNHGIKDPFEIHVVPEEMLEYYKKRARLIEITRQ